MALLLAIQCQHTATAETRARKAERLAAHRGDQVLELIESANRLRSLLAHEADQHACRRLTATNHRQARTIDRLTRQLDPHRPRHRAVCARKENARGR
jgi:hypothetical protein